MGRLRLRRIWRALATVAAMAAGGCSQDAAPGFDEAPELEAGPLLGKEDSAGVPGLPVAGNYADTTVWEVRNQWEDADTPASRAAGIAWGENSGLNWDQKFARWIASFERTPAMNGGDTFTITTPFGKSLPAPKIDCADTAIMLRISFAAWYGLPFYLIGHDGAARVHFGHFGIRTSRGAWSGAPAFAREYRDYSAMSPSEYRRSWPRDDRLRARGVQTGDEQAFLGPGARMGAYLDEIHLNKRAAHFIRLALIYLGSANLADSLNTYNLTPEAVRAGDTLLFRWARQGVGHTMVVIRSRSMAGGRIEVENAYGSLPPIQPIWQGPGESRRNFTDATGGGPGYADLGGGLKRWRVAKNVGGSWTNAWMTADEASWINDRDLDRIAARPAQFEVLLGEASPEQQRDLLLRIIQSRRDHLSQYPASCSARTAREAAFRDLYALMRDRFGTDRTEVDRRYRVFADYVFAELDYTRSKTCCWNRTTPQMYRIIMDYNESLQAGGCRDPVVFKARGGEGYAVFRDYAAATGRAAQWLQWTEDEACPQRGTSEDVEAAHQWTPWCSLGGGGGTPACVEDVHEENDSRAAARRISPGQIDGAVCSGDDDYYAVAGDGRRLAVTLAFDHSRGDLDLDLTTGTGVALASSTGTGNTESVETTTRSGENCVVRIYGYRGAEGAYRLGIALR